MEISRDSYMVGEMKLCWHKWESGYGCLYDLERCNKCGKHRTKYSKEDKAYNFLFKCILIGLIVSLILINIVLIYAITFKV